MFVRVEGSRVETCPIAGTAKRTGDPLQDVTVTEHVVFVMKGGKVYKGTEAAMGGAQ